MTRLRVRLRRSLPGVVLVGLGLALAGWHVQHLLAHGSVTLLSALAGAAWPFLAALVVVVVGARTYARQPSGALAMRTATWCLLGAGAFLLTGVLVVVHETAEGGSLADPSGLVATATTMGAAAGAVLGWYDARGKRRYRQYDALFENLVLPAGQYEIVDGAGPAGTTAAERDVVFRDVNPAFEALFGREADRVVDRPVRGLELTDPETVTELIRASDTAAGGSVRREITLRTAGGLREFELFLIPFDVGDASRTGVAVGVDVTDRKRQLRHLQVLNRVLRHDLRNSANVIAGYATLLAEDATGTDAEHAETIRSTAEEMVALGERVRTLERAGGADDPGAVVELAPIVEAEADALRRSVDEAVDVELSGIVGGELPPVSASRLLDVAIRNVLGNAVEHNDAAVPRVVVSATTVDGFVVLTVADDGPGMPASELEAFERGMETQLSHSSGLGLWLARWIVEESGGELRIGASGMGGTTVTLLLPVARESGGRVGADRRPPGEDDPGDVASSAVSVADSADP